MRLFRRTQSRVGLPPGTIRYEGEPRTEKVGLTIIDYGPSHLEEKAVESVEEVFPYRDTEGVTWINVAGIHDASILSRLGEHFGIHPLVLEDVINTHQRPKVEDYDEYLYLVFRMLFLSDNAFEIKGEQISLILGPRFVLSFQESEGDVFDAVRARIRKGTGRLRKMKSDYLAYALTDAVIDQYFVILEALGEKIETIEESLLQDADAEAMQTIHHLKRESILLRKAVWPLREALNMLQRAESQLVRKATGVFLRDAADHAAQVIDAVDSSRDMLSGLQDLHLSTVSHRMNEVMKVLTIIATIFVPLTFIAGIYGMNFEHIPELKWKWSYLVFWVFVLGVGIFMLGYFRKRRWL